jgi:hypothetical protein
VVTPGYSTKKPYSAVAFNLSKAFKGSYFAGGKTTGDRTKKPYSAVACNLSKAFKGTSFAGRKTNNDRNAALEKEGKLFVQVLYPDKHLLTEYLSQPCISRLCSTRVEGLCMCGTATTTSSRLHSKRF